MSGKDRRRDPLQLLESARNWISKEYRNARGRPTALVQREIAPRIWGVSRSGKSSEIQYCAACCPHPAPGRKVSSIVSMSGSYSRCSAINTAAHNNFRDTDRGDKNGLPVDIQIHNSPPGRTSNFAVPAESIAAPPANVLGSGRFHQHCLTACPPER